MNKPLSIIVVRYCDFTIQIFNLNERNKYVPHNGRNIGNYEEDYKYMCVACESYYIKKIKQEDYNNLLNVCNKDKLYYIYEDTLPTTSNNIIKKLIDEVVEIQNKYLNDIFIHNYDCVEYDDINEDDCYIMFINVEI
jgi:hypothetical protein